MTSIELTSNTGTCPRCKYCCCTAPCFTVTFTLAPIFIFITTFIILHEIDRESTLYWINTGILGFIGLLLILVWLLSYYISKYDKSLLRNSWISWLLYSFVRIFVDCCIQDRWLNICTQKFSNFEEDVENKFEVLVQSALINHYTYVLVNKILKTLTIVDPMEPERLMDELERLGYGEKDGYTINSILICSNNFDHVGGLYAFRNMEVEIISPYTHPELTEDKVNGFEFEVIYSEFFCPNYAYYVKTFNGEELPQKFCCTGHSILVAGICAHDGTTKDAMNFVKDIDAKLDDNTVIFGGHEISKKGFGFSIYYLKSLCRKEEDIDQNEERYLNDCINSSEKRFLYAEKQLENKTFVSSTWEDERKSNIVAICILGRSNNGTLKNVTYENLKSSWKEYRKELKNKSFLQVLELPEENMMYSEEEEELGNIKIKTSDTSSTPDAGMKYIEEKSDKFTEV